MAEFVRLGEGTRRVGMQAEAPLGPGFYSGSNVTIGQKFMFARTYFLHVCCRPCVESCPLHGAGQQTTLAEHLNYYVHIHVNYMYVRL